MVKFVQEYTSRGCILLLFFGKNPSTIPTLVSHFQSRMLTWSAILDQCSTHSRVFLCCLSISLRPKDLIHIALCLRLPKSVITNSSLRIFALLTMGATFSQFFPPKPNLTETNLPSQEGKVFIVTGGASGK